MFQIQLSTALLKYSNLSPAALAATLLQPPASAGGMTRRRRVSGVAAQAVAPTAPRPFIERITQAEAGGWRSVAASAAGGDTFRRLLGQALKPGANRCRR